MLLVFINEKQLKRDSLSEVFISEKAPDINSDLVRKALGANSKDFGFKAGREWLTMFYKEKRNIQCT